jgi:two-component system, NtrC family, response regulator PilR
MTMQAMVVEDDAQVRSFVSLVLAEDGWEVSEADSAEEAFLLLRKQNWALVVCDVNLGGEDGFSVLHRFKETLPNTQVVLITGNGSAVGAMNATAFGAYDYLLKPFGIPELKTLSASVKERIASSRSGDLGRAHPKAPVRGSDVTLVGRSRAFVEIMKQLGRVAPTNLPVLLNGESGTGKEVVARALHYRSNRKDMPFVAVNCGAIPSELIEAELFGHVRGSFTGAERDRAGLFEEANGGTVFLDEITETTPAFQVKLLRTLQEGEVRRVGSNRTQTVDVRVVAASNCDVDEEVRAGRFRKDLFYRLNAVTIYLPPLRERREDIFPLANYFGERVWSLNPPVRFSPEVLALLDQYPWPGNIRELENAVVRAVALCKNVVRPEDLPERVRNFRPDAEIDKLTELPLTNEEDWLTLSEAEGRYVARVLAHTSGNKVAAARLLGIDRKRVDRILKRQPEPS